MIDIGSVMYLENVLEVDLIVVLIDVMINIQFPKKHHPKLLYTPRIMFICDLLWLLNFLRWNQLIE